MRGPGAQRYSILSGLMPFSSYSGTAGRGGEGANGPFGAGSGLGAG